MVKGMSEFERIKEFDTVNLYSSGFARVIELNRPESRNAWGIPMCDDLKAAIQICAEDDVRALMITGAGKGFCSGAELGGSSMNAPTDADGNIDLEKVLQDAYRGVFEQLRALPIPVIAAVNGAAAGVGMSLALASDMIYIADSAKIFHAFTRLNLGPDGGASLWLLARLGLTRASGMMFEGQSITGAKAVELGLANEVLPDEGFRAAIEAKTLEFANGPVLAHKAIKQLLNIEINRQFDEFYNLESKLQGELGRSEDFMMAAMAFMTKQKPEFKGR